LAQTVNKPSAPLTPAQRRFGTPLAGSVASLIGAYKAAVTRSGRLKGLLPPTRPLWQGRFWDRVIRDESELHTIRDYIRTNPARWLADQLHPDAPPNQFNP
jgi:putative transposase